MARKLSFIVFTLAVFFLINAVNVSAIGKSFQCDPNDNLTNHDCDTGLYCKPIPANPSVGTCETTIGRSFHCDPKDNLSNHGCSAGLSCTPTTANPDIGSCEGQVGPPAAPPAAAPAAKPDPFASIFGKIQPPDPIKGFLAKDPTGASGISKFLSNLIALIYSISAIVLIFMLLWGAFEWMTSGGDKEKIEAARRRIISAILGIILFAVAFAVIQILGVFTGFKFFKGQGVTRMDPNTGFKFQCPDGVKVGGNISDDPDVACKGHGT